MLKKRLKTLWYWFAVMCCRCFCRLFFRMRVYGIENIPAEGGFLLVSNHQSFLDPLFCGIFVKRALYFLARDTLFRNKFFGPLISSVHAMPVKRGTADTGAMKRVISKLKEGAGVCLFPEGTRSRDGRISAFKPGLGLLCRRGDAAIVPVMIDGAFECWPRDKKLFSPGSISICYGKAITAEEVRQIGDKALAQRLTETLRRMQNQCRIKQGKEPYNYE